MDTFRKCVTITSTLFIVTFSAPESTHIDARLKTFWEIENTPTNIPTIYTDKKKLCEEHYSINYTKTSEGRYVVRLPVRENYQLGESRETAQNRFIQLERRLRHISELRSSYIHFMREYISLGHMKKSETLNNLINPIYFIPHHAVVKESSTTTKVRVVFDALSKSSNGVALNEIMLIGPKRTE